MIKNVPTTLNMPFNFNKKLEDALLSKKSLVMK